MTHLFRLGGCWGHERRVQASWPIDQAGVVARPKSAHVWHPCVTYAILSFEADTGSLGTLSGSWNPEQHTSSCLGQMCMQSSQQHHRCNKDSWTAICSAPGAQACAEVSSLQFSYTHGATQTVALQLVRSPARHQQWQCHALCGAEDHPQHQQGMWRVLLAGSECSLVFSRRALCIWAIT